MKKKIIYSALGVIGVIVVAAIGLRVYTGFRAGTGEPTREVAAERVAPEERRIGSIQYGVLSGNGRSEAQFLIEEVIFGRENLVEGVTDQIDGSIILSFEEGTVDVGQFEINVRAIRTRSRSFDIEEENPNYTDSERDQVIRAYILESGRDEFEFTTFDPTEVRGAPDSFEPGDVLNLEVAGDLTIRDVTSPVTFDMEIRIDSEEAISGSASTVITWDDFDISIPYVGGGSVVASVDDSVELRLEFAAEREDD